MSSATPFVALESVGTRLHQHVHPVTGGHRTRIGDRRLVGVAQLRRVIGPALDVGVKVAGVLAGIVLVVGDAGVTVFQRLLVLGEFACSPNLVTNAVLIAARIFSTMVGRFLGDQQHGFEARLLLAVDDGGAGFQQVGIGNADGAEQAAAGGAGGGSLWCSWGHSFAGVKDRLRPAHPPPQPWLQISDGYRTRERASACLAA